MEAQGDLGVKFFPDQHPLRLDVHRLVRQRRRGDGGAPGELQPHRPGAWHGWVLETQNQYRADMARIREEYMWKAITGRADTGDDWDTYIAQWMRAGGEAVLAEARTQHAGM